MDTVASDNQRAQELEGSSVSKVKKLAKVTEKEKRRETKVPVTIISVTTTLVVLLMAITIPAGIVSGIVRVRLLYQSLGG